MDELRSERESHEPQQARRGFLKQAGALPLAVAASTAAASTAAASTAAASTAAASTAAASQAETSPLPQIRIGQHSVSRLICGANCFNGGSHLSIFVNRAMREYYTHEQIFKTLKRCEEVGINCWQAGRGNIDLYQQFVDQGLKMKFIAIDAGDAKSIKHLSDGGCLAIAHHGEVTDRHFKEGKLDAIHDYLKRVRDAGLAVGVSTHIPDVVDAIESKGWDVDYYMTCVYQRHRNKEELEELLGQAPIPVGEVYLPNDPLRMYETIRRTYKPCLAFKILAAGRLSDRRHWVEQAYKQAYESIKSSDGIIVGIYDRYSDQPAEGAKYTTRYGSQPTPA